MVVSLRKLKKFFKEQKMLFNDAFIDLTKAFELISRDDLFKTL